MIIVNLKGGLGNQMFQYAIGRALALKNNDVLKLDTSNLAKAKEQGDIYRPFDLEAFSIEKNSATATETEATHYPFGSVSKLCAIFARKVLRQTHVVFEPRILEKHGDIYLDGYFQSPKYFENIRETLCKEFTLAKPLSRAATDFAAQIKESTSVAIHIRRGDYIKNPQVAREFGPCTLTYYTAALAEIEKIVQNPTYFIFSDDLPWVKENLSLGERAVFVHGEGMTSAEELLLMSQCQHNIIANSSFSWWSAWLNQNPNKIVIAPTPWFDTIAYDKNLIPNSWMQLPK